MEQALEKAGNYLKKHGAILTFVVTFVTGSWWLHHSLAQLQVKFLEGLYAVESRLNDKIDGVEKSLGARINLVEKDVAIIKTVLIMKGYMPPEMAATQTSR